MQFILIKPSAMILSPAEATVGAAAAVEEAAAVVEAAAAVAADIVFNRTDAKGKDVSSRVL